MTAYERVDFEPPAPVARVVVSTPDGRSELAVPMLIDTGADVSVVPRSLALRLGAVARPTGVLLEMYDGTRSESEVVDLRVELVRFRFAGAFVLMDAEHGVLGRNILNLLVLTLDGPRQEWSL